MEDFGLNDQDELAGIALDIMRSFRSLELDQGMDGQSISMLAVVVEKLFLQASNMANELDENRDRISELCQQVEDFVKGNGKLRDELRCLIDSHEIVSKIRVLRKMTLIYLLDILGSTVIAPM